FLEAKKYRIPLPSEWLSSLHTPILSTLLPATTTPFHNPNSPSISFSSSIAPLRNWFPSPPAAMAALQQSLSLASPVSQRHHYQQPRAALSAGLALHCSRSLFNGQSLRLPCNHRTASIKRNSQGSSGVVVTMMAKPSIQFIQGTDEQTIPDVKLTKSRDGTNGMAIFNFEQPSVFDSSGELGDITGFFMIDEEGVLQSVDVSAKFVNGKPARIEAKYVMRTPREWDRFMRFMERYANANGLQFVKK
ncbi:unnamed protein product, partial [Linum tenue]